MYVEHFGFQEDPFGVSPNPRFLYLGPVHHEAFAALLYGVKMRRGFLCMTGDPGTGKTTLLYALRDRLDGSLKTVLLPGTDLTFKQRLQFILESLGFARPSGTVLGLTRKLQELLAEEWRTGGNVVLIIDEAQGLTVRELEDIRLLTNFETPQAKLMQVVLVGQPQLKAKLDSPALAQLKQRITVNVSLKPLTPSEMAEYIEHRLRVVHWKRPLHALFDHSALTAIYDASKGNPRLINTVCHNALLIAYAENQRRIDVAMIQEAAQELELVEGTAIVQEVTGEASVVLEPRPEAAVYETETEAVDANVAQESSLREVATEEAVMGEAKTADEVVAADAAVEETLAEAANQALAEDAVTQEVPAEEPVVAEIATEEAAVSEEPVQPEASVMLPPAVESDPHSGPETSPTPPVPDGAPAARHREPLEAESARRPDSGPPIGSEVAGHRPPLMRPNFGEAADIPIPPSAWWAQRVHSHQPVPGGHPRRPSLRQLLNEMEAAAQASKADANPGSSNGGRKQPSPKLEGPAPASHDERAPRPPAASSQSLQPPVERTRSSFRLALWVTLLCLATHWAGIVLGLTLEHYWPGFLWPASSAQEPLSGVPDHQASPAAGGEEAQPNPVSSLPAKGLTQGRSGTGEEPAQPDPAPSPSQTSQPADPPPAEATREQRVQPQERVVTVRKNDTLGRILRREYGFVNRRLMRLVLAANPDVKNWDYLEVGQQIKLPAGLKQDIASSGENL